MVVRVVLIKNNMHCHFRCYYYYYSDLYGAHTRDLLTGALQMKILKLCKINVKIEAIHKIDKSKESQIKIKDKKKEEF